MEHHEMREKNEKGRHSPPHSHSGDTHVTGKMSHASMGGHGADAQEHEGHGDHHDHHAHMVADFRKRFYISLVLTIPILLLSPMIQGFLGLGTSLRFTGDLLVSFVFSSIVFFYGGFPFLKGIYEELKKGQPGMMTLIALAISVAYFYSAAVVFGVKGKIFFWELATLIDIMLLGHWIEMKSVMGASRALEALAQLMPPDAHKILNDGEVEDVPLSSLKPGDMVLIKPGERVPADGKVVEGDSSLNESMLTGESKPVSKHPGNPVIGGSLNGEGALKVAVEKTGKDSFLSQVIDLVRQAQESKSKTQDIANRAAFWLTLIAIGAGAVTLFVWLAVAGKDFAFALERTVTVMVITCPHALGLAVPLVVAVSTAIAAKNGLLIRDRGAFEKARNLQAVIFDKTGTLTEGKFGVTDVVSLDENIPDEHLLAQAASIEALSEHPLAQAIAHASGKALPVTNFKAIPGKGAQGEIGGILVQVVSPGFLKEKGLQVDDPRVTSLFDGGKTVVFILQNGSPLGAIALSDMVRPESKEAVARLKEMGIRTIMLTGDNRQVAGSVARQIGIDEIFAEVLPNQKADKVREIRKRGMIVAMTGDGVNDAPALAEADIGIAIGAGTEVAVETADIVLVRSNPLDVLAIVSLARATYKKMLQNLGWATGYNAFAIPLAAGVLYKFGILLSPAAGAILMSLSTVIVAINARLLKIER